MHISTPYQLNIDTTVVFLVLLLSCALQTSAQIGIYANNNEESPHSSHVLPTIITYPWSSTSISIVIFLVFTFAIVHLIGIVYIRKRLYPAPTVSSKSYKFDVIPPMAIFMGQFTQNFNKQIRGNTPTSAHYRKNNDQPSHSSDHLNTPVVVGSYDYQYLSSRPRSKEREDTTSLYSISSKTLLTQCNLVSPISQHGSRGSGNNGIYSNGSVIPPESASSVNNTGYHQITHQLVTDVIQGHQTYHTANSRLDRISPSRRSSDDTISTLNQQ